MKNPKKVQFREWEEQVRTVRPKEAKRRERLTVSYGPKGKMGKAEKGSGFSNKKNTGDLLSN